MKQNKRETRLVYSSDGSHLKLCKKCGEDPCECSESPKNIVSVVPEKTTLKIKLEKNQRGGKLVTVIHDLPHNPTYFEDLAKKLKNLCGTGGTFKNDAKAQIELQGDHREKVEALLAKSGFKVKRSGGWQETDGIVLKNSVNNLIHIIPSRFPFVRSRRIDLNRIS